MTTLSDPQIPINVRMGQGEVDELDKAVVVMRLGGKNTATKREWSREAFIRLAVSRAVADVKSRCGGEWPSFLQP